VIEGVLERGLEAEGDLVTVLEEVTLIVVVGELEPEREEEGETEVEGDTDASDERVLVAEAEAERDLEIEEVIDTEGEAVFERLGVAEEVDEADAVLETLLVALTEGDLEEEREGDTDRDEVTLVEGEFVNKTDLVTLTLAEGEAEMIVLTLKINQIPLPAVETTRRSCST